MNRVVGAAKATYNFFAGDAILLVAVLIAFALTGILLQLVHAPNLVAAVLFIAIIVGGLALTLSRELHAKGRA